MRIYQIIQDGRQVEYMKTPQVHDIMFSPNDLNVFE